MIIGLRKTRRRPPGSDCRGGVDLQIVGSVRPQGGARERKAKEGARLPELQFPGGIARAPGRGYPGGGACGRSRVESSRGADGGAGEGPGGVPEAQLPVPGRPLRPRAGPREPGASEVLLPHGEDHSEAARITAGPLGEADSLPWLLLPPHPGSDLHPAPETLQGSALDCTDLPDMPAQPTVPQRPEACALGRPARGPAGEPGRSQTTTALAKHSPPHCSPGS